jgi:molybdate transport system substrate-binding protein
VYASDVTPLVAPDLLTLAIPVERNITADYPLTVSADSAAPQLANQFVEFVLSTRGQTLLAEHGFRPTQTQAIGQNQ